MTADPIAAYLANGGSITKCPPGYAAYGWTSQCAVSAVPSDVCAPENPIRKSKPASEAAKATLLEHSATYNEKRAQARKERLAGFAKRFNDGLSIEDLAAQEGCSVELMRRYLRECGAIEGIREQQARRLAEMRPLALELRRQGMGVATIAKKLGCGNGTVDKLLGEA